MGCVAPDLPYASIADNDIFQSETEIADKFHYEQPNRLPIIALRALKSLNRAGFPVSRRNEFDALFCFFVGYASHVIADGIFHPFVLDQVGQYAGNMLAHTALEIGIDVLTVQHLTEQSGEAIEANYSGVEDELGDFENLDHANVVLGQFTRSIRQVYGQEVSTKKVLGWITGIHRLFTIGLGNHPQFLRKATWTEPFFFRNAADLKGREDRYLTLTKPKFWDNNFLGAQRRINVLEDCIPHFNREMLRFFDLAYTSVYESGAELTDRDFPEFDLDTGRPISARADTAIIPVMWRSA
jgi:hypothetical protein